MRRISNLLFGVALSIMILSTGYAQKIDDERMDRDIAVAENVLSTLIKQQFNNQRTFFSLEISGSYQAGYGVSFTIPADYSTPIALMLQGAGDPAIWGEPAMTIGRSDDGYTVRYGENQSRDMARMDAQNAGDKSVKLKERGATRQELDMDSIRDAYNLKVIEAAKMFLLDYGDLIAQLAPNEKVVISNQGSQPRVWVNQFFTAPKRTHLSVEALKSDLTQYREGKITRPQALAKLKVVNTETVDEVAPDLELLSSIFTRLYGQDLSKTYFVGDNVYFERLKDFGVIYYMQMYSGIERNDFSKRYYMPTIGLTDVDQATKDKKVKELYPKFEKDLKDNILEYGRTLKSLKDDEVLVFQVAMTKCAGCDVPSSLEISLKGAALKDFNSGKANKDATMAKFSVKKGPNQ